ncbi:MBL fold metallo-hydrolase [Roseibium aggregatum]|uniref:MBL fold metallo-hydrolase n=1 Tax=Roseibium aggregatum TaxID=187304 RepID=A0A939J386_9HYPH|nr:MBL fold metallo-hydrolase [Roseibium aggregatum]MBN9673976.1 MBL fold metallo-hydrolase [Roseibium aggregatum]
MLETATHSPVYRLGGLTLTCLSDGHLLIPGTYFPNADASEKEKVTPHTRFGANTWLVETGTRKILIDAGSGTSLKDRFPASGALDWRDSRLAARRDGITDVVVTHMHADHIGGLASQNRSLFPKARIHVQEKEWAFWTDEALLAAAPDDRKPMIALIQSLARPLTDQIVRHSGEADLGGGVRLLPAPGHTPGHQIAHLSDGDGEILLLGDVVVSDTLQFSNPDVTYALDRDPEQAVETRKRLFEWLTADEIPFAATHINATGLCRLEKRAAGYGFNPL